MDGSERKRFDDFLAGKVDSMDDTTASPISSAARQEIDRMNREIENPVAPPEPLEAEILMAVGSDAVAVTPPVFEQVLDPDMQRFAEGMARRAASRSSGGGME